MKNKKFSFANAPTIHMPRNSFDLSHRQLTTATTGRLQPFLVQPVIPGDTFKIDETTVCKVSSAFLKPPAGNLWFETYYFFVPNRLVMENFANVVGAEADPDAWEQPEELTIPVIQNAGVTLKSVADFMRVPKRSTSAGAQNISLLPFRAFALIYDTWFRNQNVIDKMAINTGDTRSTQEVGLNGNNWSANNYVGMCPSVGKYKDLFTTCLPSPQKGDAVNVPIGVDNAFLDTVGDEPTAFSSGNPLSFKLTPTLNDGARMLGLVANQEGVPYPQVGAYGTDAMNIDGDLMAASASYISGSNLALTVDAGNFTINDLRQAFAMQRHLEKLARIGTRYQEILNGIWGVNSPDARLQRPEYLAGKKTLINFQQVAQTSSSTDGSPQASLTAYSNTVQKQFVGKTFVEHGYIIGVCTIRQQHIYQQGLERHWTRLSKEDIYEPTFAHIGEQPVYTYELFDNSSEDIFGYQEAWYDYRQRSSAVTGEMSSQATNTLDIWHFGDEYVNAPVLSKEFIEEKPNFVDRTLAVPSTSQDQFIVDTWFDIKAIRRLPVHSIPGLIDHY